MLGMEAHWDNRHHRHTMFPWKLGCHCNQSETSITHLSFILFGAYLVWRFIETTGISIIPHCYVNLVAMAARLNIKDYFLLIY